MVASKKYNWVRKKNLSKNLIQQLGNINLISRISCKERKIILKSLGIDVNFYAALSEIIHNVLKGNINIDKNSRNKLFKYRNTLRLFDCKNSLKSQATRKKLIIQSGGFLPILIPAIIGALGHISGTILNKVIK